MKKTLLSLIAIFGIFGLIGCTETTTANTYDSSDDKNNTLAIGDKLVQNQPTPTDIDYSLERYNLIKRTYWVNGMRDKANSYPSPITDIPLGYVVLFSESGNVVGQFTVEGKVSSLNSYLTPDSECYEIGGEGTDNDIYYNGTHENDWLPDVDGSYGENDTGIFFFTTDGKYVEWTGTYLYSDIPFSVGSTVLGEY